MQITIDRIKELRETGCGIMNCRSALRNRMAIWTAMQELREKGLKTAEKALTGWPRRRLKSTFTAKVGWL